MDTIRDYQVTFHLLVMALSGEETPKSKYENHKTNFVFMISDSDMIELFERLLKVRFTNPEELKDGKDDRLYMFYVFMIDQIAESVRTQGAERLQCDPLGFCFLDMEFLGLGRAINEDAPEEVGKDLHDWRNFVLQDPTHYTNIVIQDKGISKRAIN